LFTKLTLFGQILITKMSENKNRKRSPNFSKDQLKVLIDEYTKNKEILDSSVSKTYLKINIITIIYIVIKA
jgi:hypothetical protein